MWDMEYPEIESPLFLYFLTSDMWTLYISLCGKMKGLKKNGWFEDCILRALS